MAGSVDAAREAARDDRSGRFGEQHLADPGSEVLPQDDPQVAAVVEQLGNLDDNQFAAVLAGLESDRLAGGLGAIYYEPGVKRALIKGLRDAYCQPILIDLDYTADEVAAALNARGLEPDDDMYNALMRDVAFEIGSAGVGFDDAVSDALAARVRTEVQKVIVERYGTGDSGS